MDRRTFLKITGLWVGGSEALAARSSTVWRIGALTTGTREANAPYKEQFLLGLRNLGYLEGQNLALEVRYDEGHPERLPALAKELVDSNVDVLVAFTTPAALAAKRATASIPIVISGTSDPVGVGLIASVAHPGGNVTGQTDAAPDLTARRIQILQELVPGLRRLGALGYPSDPVWRSTWPEAQDAARQLRLDIDPILVGALDQLPVAFAGLGKRVQALFVAPQSGFWIHRKNVVALVARERLPASYESKQFVDEGGLVSYGPDYFALNRSIGRYVDKILKGTKPADLPVEMPTEFELAVNVKTARTLGLTIPPTVLARAHALVQ